MMMATEIERILSRFNRNPGAAHSTILQIEEETGIRLPDDYTEFLLNANGGEGFVGSAYVMIWRVEDLVAMNEAYQVEVYAPGLLLFGSDGGGEAFAFDMNTERMPIIAVPFIGMSRDSVRSLAPNFLSFLKVMSGTL